MEKIRLDIEENNAREQAKQERKLQIEVIQCKIMN